MNWLESISTILKAVTWPVVVILALVLLYRPLAGLIGRIKQVTFKGLGTELTVSDVLQMATTLTPLAPAAASVPKVNSLVKLAAKSPRSAIDKAYQLVKSSVDHADVAQGESGGKRRQVSTPAATRTPQPEGAFDNATKDMADEGASDSVTESIVDEGGLDSLTKSMVDSLRSLRDQAVHADESSVDATSARQYVQLAVALAQRINDKNAKTP